MNEDDVRDMLRQRAASVQPSRDGLQRIEAKLEGPARSPAARRLPLLAAAAVVLVALVGAVLLAQGEDGGTPVTSGSTTTSGPSATSTSTTAAAAAWPGVWPSPDDAVDPSVLDDPVNTARAYVASRVVDVGATTASDFRAGDANSGEVEFTGHVSTTVLVRLGPNGLWYVVGAASDLLPVHDAGAGEVVMTADTAGDVHGAVRSATGAIAPIDQRQVTEPGTELWRGTAGGAWFSLTTKDGAIGLAETLIVTPEPPAGEEAVLPSAGAADPRDAVVAYLKDVLGDGLTVNDFTPVDATHGEVTWEAGVVKVVKQGDRWYPNEAIGDSIQIAGTSLDAGYISGSLTLAQAGTVHLSVGTVTWDVRNDIDREGTTVRFAHDIPTDEEPIVLRAVFTTDTGYVSVAEKVVG
jgi:hypothetical protein